MHDLGTVTQVNSEKMDDDMSSFRLQAIRRLVHECKSSAGLEEKRFEGDVSKQASHNK